MLKLPELNRHIVGLSAIALAIAGVGYAARVTPMNSGAPAAQQLAELLPAEGWNPAAMLREIPPNAFGRAPAAEQEMTPQNAEANSISPDSKNWTAQDWRVAAAAVEKLRSSRPQARNNMSGVVWAPPEEIAQKTARGSMR
ncbi:hypothetical protein [Methylocystis echinoides]|nr:hypothetical protein [Methylocystis echinoides]